MLRDEAGATRPRGCCRGIDEHLLMGNAAPPKARTPTATQSRDHKGAVATVACYRRSSATRSSYVSRRRIRRKRSPSTSISGAKGRELYRLPITLA